jgi:hypothetical protein
MGYRGRIKFVVFGIVTAATASVGGTACSGGGSSGSGASTGSPTSSGSGSGTASTGSGSGAGGNSTTGAISCPNNLCAFGDSGYAFGYSDSQNMAPEIPGTSSATLATDGSLCISGNVMQLPAMPTAADYSNDWGCGIGINLNQPNGDAGPAAYQLTGSGVTVNVLNLPDCTVARVILDQNGATPNYCATLTPGVEIPWSAFNTMCWAPTMTGAVALTAAPDSQQIKVQFVTSTAAACPFTNFCISELTLNNP